MFDDIHNKLEKQLSDYVKIKRPENGKDGKVSKHCPNCGIGLDSRFF